MPTQNPNPCKYEYEHITETEPSGIVEFPRPDGTVQCPHEVPMEDLDTCLFHGVNEEYPREKATESFLNALSENPDGSCFAGGYLPGLDLSGERITTQNEEPLDLRGTIIDGVLDLTDARVTVPIILDNATVNRIIAENAVFEGPVSLVNTAVQKGMQWEGATVEQGVVANGIDAQYIDWRDLTVDGPVTFRNGSFASSLQLARAEIRGDLSLSDTSFDWHIDATTIEVDGKVDATDIEVDGDVDFIGAEIDGGLVLQKGTIEGDLNYDHTLVGGELRSNGLEVGGAAQFEDVRVHGGSVVFDNVKLGGKADFGSVAVPNGEFSANGAVFDDEVWFTHAEIGGVTDFSNATLNGDGHLRDAHFMGDLRYQNVTDTEAQTWMAGSTVEGNLSCTDTDFDHFQFSATVHGDADFTGTEYDSNATFTSSTFNGRVWFDDALFTGHPDFSKSQFTEEVSFEGTEFMVEPSFEETRFATNPELDKAEFLTDIDASMEERYRKWELILVHPESLENTGVSIHASEVSEGFGIPVDLTHLAEEDPKKTNSFDSILKDIDSSSWSDVISNALPKARTAVTRLEDGKTGTVVYGVEFGENADSPEEAIQEVAVACVYELQGDTFEFTHISTEMSEFDYLVPVPISDDSFEGGAEVATKKETRKAMMRHERFRLRQLVRGESLETDEGPSVHKAVAPLLAAAGKV